MIRYVTARIAPSATALGAAAAIALGGADRLAAQNATFTFVGETAGDDVSLLLGDADFLFGLGQIRPVIGLQAYVIMDEATDAATMWALTPSVGLRFAQPTGFFQGKVGYAWTNVEADARVPFFGGGETGVTSSLHGEYWGDGRFGLQGIGFYNWGANYLWSRGRATARVFRTADGGVNLGGEAGWQGHAGGDTELDYSATMFGPVVQWVMPNVTAGIGAGWKNTSGALQDNASTWYARLELSFTPF
jgi:hypothetical protein